MEYLLGLNENQELAVKTTEGPVRVAAGPGAGKTRALTSRYCYLVDSIGISPGQILTCTFTNKAAQEMKRRVRDYLGDMDLGYISTIHAFCVLFLKEEIHLLNFPKNFVILDTDDQKATLGQIFRDMKIGLKDLTIQKALDEILEANKLSADDYIDKFYLLDNEKLKRQFLACAETYDEIFLRYIYEQKKVYGLDFNDLIVFTIYILENFPDILEKWSQKMQYVMIDEFQDVSSRQYKLARLLAGYHGNIFIVGDPDQTIYSWRGAHVELFLNFPREYPKAVTIDLNLNYRSTPAITAVANSLISHNETRLKREIVSTREAGPKPQYFHARNDQEENEWICQEIKKIRDAGDPLSEIAILYRAHSYVTRDLEERLTTKKIPYHIYSGVEFYRRKEIKDVICYLRMVAHGDDAAFYRTHNIPSRKIGQKTRDYLRQYADERGLTMFQALKDNLGTEALNKTQAGLYVRAIENVQARRAKMSLDNLLQTLLDQTGYEEYIRLQGDEDRLENVAELKRALASFAQDDEATLEDFLIRAALFSETDHQKVSDKVKLMTIHAAKGLEFKQVFLIGLSEGVLPSQRCQDREDIEEERRLAYVAMTRAIDRLYLSDSAGKTDDGYKKTPSRFIAEIDDHLLHYLRPKPTAAKPRKNSPPLPRPENIFPAGALVKHKDMGPGRILKVDLENGLYVVKFDQMSTERSLRLNSHLSLLDP
ncbi:MAG: UvrD-helicase domain-containing protein [Deltaproteobacteria bacterium]|jgi:DNA helicase-2/ATP-dependent DNA helicase PcrA|nr:UvrD-helicase domain-containing protein [Deltaproteobacteria bacterium]